MSKCIGAGNIFLETKNKGGRKERSDLKIGLDGSSLNCNLIVVSGFRKISHGGEKLLIRFLSE